MRRFWYSFVGLSGLGLLAYLIARPQVLPIRANSQQPQAGFTNPMAADAASTPFLSTASPEIAFMGQGPVTNSSPNSKVPADSPAATAAPPATTEDSESASALLERVRRLFVQFNAMFGENPVGTNEEITRALHGENPKEIDFLQAEVYPQNGKGELIDAWGTAFFFHQLSAKNMEIRSAGPDKVMWTSDDLVTR